jgi:hypothetical protein
MELGCYTGMCMCTSHRTSQWSKFYPRPVTAPALRELATLLENRSRGLLEPGVWTQDDISPEFPDTK